MEQQEKKSISPSDLRKKQSMRTTFKLPQSTIEDISWLSKHLGITKKELFDEIILDNTYVDEYKLDFFGAQELTEEQLSLAKNANVLELMKPYSEELSKFNRFLKSFTENSVRKTFVISKGALKELSALANKKSTEKNFKISRDEVLGIFVLYAKEQIIESLEEQCADYDYVREKVQKISENLTELLSHFSIDVDKDIFDRLGLAEDFIDFALTKINEFLEKNSKLIVS